jgi:hypothetical protein
MSVRQHVEEHEALTVMLREGPLQHLLTVVFQGERHLIGRH